MPSEQIWFKDPSVLFTNSNGLRFVPTQKMTSAEMVNAGIRFTTYFSILMFVVTHKIDYLTLVPAVLVATYVLYEVVLNGKIKALNIEKFTMPTPNNPFMNVLLTDIGDNPDREDAAPVSSKAVRDQMAKAFQHTNDLQMDTSDMFDQAQAMRTFHTLQSARVPNDQDGFLSWLAKGYDEEDISSAPLARGGKIISGGYTPARGSALTLPSTTAKPTATPPTKT